MHATKRKWSATHATLFREKLKLLKDASFLVEDDTTLSEATELLQQIEEIFQKAIPKETGIWT